MWYVMCFLRRNLQVRFTGTNSTRPSTAMMNSFATLMLTLLALQATLIQARRRKGSPPSTETAAEIKSVFENLSLDCKEYVHKKFKQDDFLEKNCKRLEKLTKRLFKKECTQDDFDNLYTVFVCGYK